MEMLSRASSLVYGRPIVLLPCDVSRDNLDENRSDNQSLKRAVDSDVMIRARDTVRKHFF
jgi:hypothetical protein